MMNNPQNVYIVDDDAAVRDALSILVQSVGLTPFEYESANLFLEQFELQHKGVLITDVYLPGMDGVTLQKHLNKIGSHMPMIVMSGHGDIPMAVKMIHRGALDFIEKPFRNHQMLERIQQALSQDAMLCNNDTNRDQLENSLSGLTPREKETLNYLIHGHANKVVARKMDVSPRTIEAHRANILRKMNSKSVVKLAQQISSLNLSLK